MVTIFSVGILILGLSFWIGPKKQPLFLILFLLLGSGAAIALTNSNVGLKRAGLKTPQSIRQESTGSRQSFFLYYGARSHMGGGMSGGK